MMMRPRRLSDDIDAMPRDVAPSDLHSTATTTTTTETTTTKDIDIDDDDSAEGSRRANSASSIRIFVRIRPPRPNSKLRSTPGRCFSSNPDSPDEHARIGFHIPKDDSQGIINNQKESYDYRFHRVFDDKASQEEVFDRVAKDVILSVMEGYNGTIFAYGQTGSGKTFTITGGAERYADRGLIPRSLQFIFQEGKKRPGHHYEVSISYLEIYNENGYDLLDSTRDAKRLEDLPKVKLMEDSDSTIHLQNITVVPAPTEEEALNLLFLGDTNRMIAETPSNPSSSRSHCIFIINITSRRDGNDTIRRSKLHLVDLAGSERTSRTGIAGKLFTEASYINLSLHYLEQVIIALHEKAQGKRTHIPYRNSMMTSVLRDSLGGNCMTTMIATVATEDDLIEESISTCRFAQRVALISNIAHVNEEYDPQLLIAKLRREITRLKAELALARGGVTDGDGDLPPYEKERVKVAVDQYVGDSSADAALVFSDFRRIQEAFRIMKAYIVDARAGRVAAAPAAEKPAAIGIDEADSVELQRLRTLIANRDNEINILIGMINQYKVQCGDKPIENRPIPSNQQTIAYHSSSPSPIIAPTRPAIAPTALIPQSRLTRPPDLTASIPAFTTEKARAFEIFKAGYPSGGWIDGQKSILRDKYAAAKKLGESASKLRLTIKNMKEQLAMPDDDDPATASRKEQLRSEVSDTVSRYREAYEQLKALKIEIEHLQHLLEQARVRLTRDFEHWYLNVYLVAGEVEGGGGLQQEATRSASVVSMHRDERPSTPDSRRWNNASADQSPASSTTTLVVPASARSPTPQDQTPTTPAHLFEAQQKLASGYHSGMALPLSKITSQIDRPASAQSNRATIRSLEAASATTTYSTPRPPQLAGDIKDDLEAFYKAREGIMSGKKQAAGGGGDLANALKRLGGGSGFIGRISGASSSGGR